MTKLSKTQTELLREAAKNRHGLCHTDSGFYAGGRQGTWGVRRRDAASRLYDQGLLVRHSHSNHRHHMTGGWTTAHCFETTWQITDQGRALLGEVK